MAELGFHSQISGRPNCDYKEIVPKQSHRFMGDAAGWTAVEMKNVEPTTNIAGPYNTLPTFRHLAIKNG